MRTEMDLGIKGKYALVTGGTHGIGWAIAQALAQEGCNVAICGRSNVYPEGFMTIHADVTHSQGVDHVIDEVISHWEKLDILVNNVGGGGRWGSDDPVTTSEDVWKEVYEKNAMAAVRFTMRVIPHMRKQKWGRVVTISSIHGREGGGRPWFSMAKAAEIALMKTLAMNPEYQKDNITFNTVAPGPIWIPDKEHDYYERYGSPEDVASLVAFLCSKQSKWVNGACIVVDGGQSRSF